MIHPVKKMIAATLAAPLLLSLTSCVVKEPRHAEESKVSVGGRGFYMRFSGCSEDDLHVKTTQMDFDEDADHGYTFIHRETGTDNDAVQPVEGSTSDFATVPIYFDGPETHSRELTVELTPADGASCNAEVWRLLDGEYELDSEWSEVIDRPHDVRVRLDYTIGSDR